MANRDMGIECKDLFVGYRRGRWVLSGVSLKIGGNTVLIGPNGSGKTTLFRAIMGLSVVNKGAVFIDGVKVDDIRGRPNLIATNLQEIGLPLSVKVKELVKLYLDIMGGDYDLFLRYMDLFKAQDALDKVFHQLSSGYRVIVMDSLALASKAKYTLLDEPFENLDPHRRTILLKEILSNQSTIVMNTHMTWMLKYVEDWSCYVVFAGKVYNVGCVKDLLSSKISATKTPDTILELRIDDKTIYLSKTTGMDISSLDTLDNLYEKLFLPSGG